MINQNQARVAKPAGVHKSIGFWPPSPESIYVRSILADRMLEERNMRVISARPAYVSTNENVERSCKCSGQGMAWGGYVTRHGINLGLDICLSYMLCAETKLLLPTRRRWSIRPNHKQHCEDQYLVRLDKDNVFFHPGIHN